MQNCLMTSPVVKSLHDNKFCKHQSPECLGFQGAQTKKNGAYFLKYCLFIKLGGVYWSALAPLTSPTWVLMSSAELQGEM